MKVNIRYRDTSLGSDQAAFSERYHEDLRPIVFSSHDPPHSDRQRFAQ